MPIKVSQQLKRELPEDHRKGIVEWLEAKAWNTCFLCQRPIDLATDQLVADHDEVKAGGGPTTRDNLNVAHSRCNAQKGGLTTVQARAILSFERYLEDKGPGLKYGEVLDHFGIAPSSIQLEEEGANVTVDFGDGRGAHIYPVFEEKNPHGIFRFAYIELPQRAISNDDDCQPRPIKVGQLRSIYLDLFTNPLHEPPTCRVEADETGNARMLMFDGQHKTIACWMHNRDAVVTKVYLDLSLDDAVTLVNSIQSKIKKLPLTPFELVAKLEHEHRIRFEEYQKQTDPADVSEAGFIKSLPPTQRTKTKQGLEAAVMRNVIEADEPLVLYEMYVKGDKLPSDQKRLTEAAFKNKVLKRLLHTGPLDERLAHGQQMRDREREHVLRALNYLAKKAFVNDDGTPLGKIESERAKRMSYQSSLQYVSHLIKRTFRAVLEPNDEARALMEKEPTPESWVRIEAGIARIVSHPIWTADWNKSAKTRAVYEALQKNQDAAKAFQAVGLTPGYVLGGDQLSATWYEDDEVG